MAVEILYCPTWSGYDARAASLAAELEKTLALDVKVTPGAKSQFDVLRDGDLVFSKAAKGRFPEDEEIIAALS